MQNSYLTVGKAHAFRGCLGATGACEGPGSAQGLHRPRSPVPPCTFGTPVAPSNLRGPCDNGVACKKVGCIMQYNHDWLSLYEEPDTTDDVVEMVLHSAEVGPPLGD